MVEKFNFSSKAKTLFISIGVIGLLLIIIGAFVDKGQATRFWANYLLCNFYFLAFSMIAVAWIAIKYLAKASWATVLKRIPEAMSGYMIIGIIAMIVFFVVSMFPIGGVKYGMFSIYSWVHLENPDILNNSVLKTQRPLMNFWMFIVVSLFLLGMYWWARQRIRRASLAEDTEGGLVNYYKQMRVSEWFMPFFGVTFCVLGFMWLMSLEPKWYSTMFSVNVFIGGFVSTMSTIVLIAVILKKNNYMSYVNGNHFHDLGKMIFGFSIFWVYTWLAQFLLIWYANMSVETIYFLKRMHGAWLVLFWCNLTINFFMPFLALMMRQSKRQYNYLVVIVIMLLCGRYIDWYLIVMPGSAGQAGQAGFGFYEIGFFMFFSSMFCYTVASQLAKANLIPMQHPFVEESVHHSI